MLRTLLITTLLSLAVWPATAHEIAAGNLTIIHPFVKATPPNGPVGGGYLRIRNDGDTDDRLVAIESPGVAKQVTMHRTVVTDGIASMAPLDEGLVVPAHGEAILGDQGTHAMFEGLIAPFGLGQLIDVTLVFEKAGRIPVAFEVEPMTANALDVIHSH